MGWGDFFSKAWSGASEAARSDATRFIEGAGTPTPQEHSLISPRAARSERAPSVEVQALFAAIQLELSPIEGDLRIERHHPAPPINDYFYHRLQGRGPFFDGWANSLVGAESVEVSCSDALFHQWTGGLTIEQSQTAFQAETGRLISREVIQILFTSPARARILLLQDPNLNHIYRNLLNANAPPDIVAARQSSDWIEVTEGRPISHAALPRRRCRFLSKDGHREVQYAPDGRLDTGSPINGTFNFYDPREYPLTHVAIDIAPYIAHSRASQTSYL